MADEGGRLRELYFRSNAWILSEGNVCNCRVKLKLYVSNKAEPEPRIDVGSSACGEVGCSLAGLVIEIDEQKK